MVRKRRDSAKSAPFENIAEANELPPRDGPDKGVEGMEIVPHPVIGEAIGDFRLARELNGRSKNRDARLENTGRGKSWKSFAIS